MSKRSLIQCHLLCVLHTLGWSSVNDKDVLDLLELDVQRESVLLDIVDNSMPNQIPVPLVFLFSQQFVHKFGISLQQLRCFGLRAACMERRHCGVHLVRKNFLLGTSEAAHQVPSLTLESCALGSTGIS